MSLLCLVILRYNLFILMNRVPLWNHLMEQVLCHFCWYFTKYIWFYPLRKRSNVREIFIHVKAIVEKFFNSSIIQLYPDNGGGGEYIALRLSSFKWNLSPNHSTSYFWTQWVLIALTPSHSWNWPYTIAPGLYATIFLAEAFAIAVYLINRMRKENLGFTSLSKIIWNLIELW